MNAGDSKTRPWMVAIVITLLTIVVAFVGFISIRAQKQRDELARFSSRMDVRYGIDPRSIRGKIGKLVGIDMVASPKEFIFRDWDGWIDMSGVIKFKSVEKLQLCGYQITIDDLALLDQMPNLRHLNISRTRISDEGIAELTDLSLLWLDIAKLSISDGVVDSLVKIRTLKVLVITQGSISQPAIDKLQLALPDCHVTVRPD